MPQYGHMNGVADESDGQMRHATCMDNERDVEGVVEFIK